jgi:FHA domain/Domain of unknown function (DUF1707)
VALDLPTPVPGRPTAADRARVVDALRAGCEEERLSVDTFSARVEAAYAARSRRQLEALVEDLGRPSPVARAARTAVGRLSRTTARVQAAWRYPRTPSLALSTAATVTVGRSRVSDCVIADPSVSRRHAVLRHADGAWFLRDLRSMNGTRVNGVRVLEEVEVRPGDRVTFGGVSYRLDPPR